jgi:sec-independent protein translocase protein TatA
LALDPIEILVIVGAVAVFLMWSPQKLPEMARALGQAKREFDKAVHEVSTAASTPPPTQGKPDDQIVATAKRLGISTDGKTNEQISQEIVSKSHTN